MYACFSSLSSNTFTNSPLASLATNIISLLFYIIRKKEKRSGKFLIFIHFYLIFLASMVAKRS
ncbi:hypothetical protein C5O69_04000 [Streptococcus pseudopneumoniae]|uniref:Uncharacterized protein n=1 Tax=Streptococcus pseudopneumoniae TaxID=257758 RepID=A0A3A4N1N1_9STRE|nr:hypothetical protein C5O69_04000 [Streptococcus pseudopneumoniae]